MISRAEFTVMMTRLRACYQNGVRDEKQWLASIAQYWEELKDRDLEAVRRAFGEAWRVHKDWMPSLGQLSALIEAQEKRTREQSKSQRFLQLDSESSTSPEEAKQRLADLVDGIGG